MKKLLLSMLFAVIIFAGDIGFYLNKYSAVQYYNYMCAVKETIQLQYLLKKIVNNNNFRHYSGILEDGQVKTSTADVLSSVLNIIDSRNFIKKIKSKKGTFYLDLSMELKSKIVKKASNSGFFYKSQKIGKLLDKMKKAKSLIPVKVIRNDLYLMLDKYIRDLEKINIAPDVIKRLKNLNNRLRYNANVYK